MARRCGRVRLCPVGKDEPRPAHSRGRGGVLAGRGGCGGPGCAPRGRGGVGVGGTLGFVLFHDSAAPFLVTWQNWFASDALGIVTVAPLVIGLASVARKPPARGETIEGFLGLALLIVMSIIVIGLPQQPWTTTVPIALLV